MTEYIYGFEPCEKIPEMKMVQREEIVRCRDCHGSHQRKSTAKKSNAGISKP